MLQESIQASDLITARYLWEIINDYQASSWSTINTYELSDWEVIPTQEN